MKMVGILSGKIKLKINNERLVFKKKNSFFSALTSKLNMGLINKD